MSVEFLLTLYSGAIAVEGIAKCTLIYENYKNRTCIPREDIILGSLPFPFDVAYAFLW